MKIKVILDKLQSSFFFGSLCIACVHVKKKKSLTEASTENLGMSLESYGFFCFISYMAKKKLYTFCLTLDPHFAFPFSSLG